MKQRGRKSANAAVVTELPGSRPRAPSDLTEFQQRTWETIVATKSSDWFTADSHDLLRAYCKHVSTAAVLDQQIDEFRPDWIVDEDGLKRYERLLVMRERQTKVINALARSMRLTQQARWQPSTAAVKSNNGGGLKPWEM